MNVILIDSKLSRRILDLYIDKLSNQKCLALLGLRFVLLEVGLLVAEVILFFTPLSYTAIWFGVTP